VLDYKAYLCNIVKLYGPAAWLLLQDQKTLSIFLPKPYNEYFVVRCKYALPKPYHSCSTTLEIPFNPYSKNPFIAQLDED
jgi:hypothetical protein